MYMCEVLDDIAVIFKRGGGLQKYFLWEIQAET